MAKPRVFLSFDYDNDDDLRTLLVNQAGFLDSPFELADWSVKGALPGDWKEKVRRRIRSTHQMIVICGLHTDTATGVSAELRIARDESIPYFLVSGRKGKTCKKPKSARLTDKVYDWTWSNLRKLIGGAR